MSNINHIITKTILCIFSVIFFLAQRAYATTLPPDPDNAALLYYQAFLICPESNDAVKLPLSAEPTTELREYFSSLKCRDTIELAEFASRIPECDWGIQYSQGIGSHQPQLVQARRLAFILGSNAIILAYDGAYQAAFERCLTIRRFAAHIGDGTYLLYVLSKNIDGFALERIRLILGLMEPNVDSLLWLKDQLIIERGSPLTPNRALKIDFESALCSLRTSEKTLIWVRDELAEKAEDENAKKEILNLTDEKLLARTREPYADFLDSALRVMDSGISYTEKYATIQKLTDSLEKEFDSDPAANQIIGACAEQVPRIYDLGIRHITYFNALKAAIEIYLVKAKTGKLPGKLPDGLPKDAFTGEYFDYAITEDGFTLRCPDEEIRKRTIDPYEFKVKKRKE